MTQVQDITWVLATVAALTSITSILYCLIPAAPRGDKKSHAVITGGSSGIGFEIAIACAKAGIRNITLVARNQEALESAQTKLSALYPSTQFHSHSLDISDYEAVKVTAPAIVEKGGPPTLLFNNAGVTSVHSFQNVPVTDFESLMKCNYLGTVYMTKSLLGYMPTGSTIMITSSMAGCVGVYGYTAYSRTKFALRGFAESLQMEVRNDGITISIACPPDTDTPMFEAENKTKPRETTLISDSAGLMKPDEVAKAMVQAALKRNPPFLLYLSLEGWMLSCLTSGMSPVHGLFDSLCQVLLMGIFRFISLFYLWDYTRIIRNCQKDNKD